MSQLLKHYYVICLAIASLTATAAAQPPESALSHAKSLSQAFRYAAEQAGPSVVTIRSNILLGKVVDDLDLTRRLVRGGEAVGVSVLDHLIVAGARWLSLRASRSDLFGP